MLLNTTCILMYRNYSLYLGILNYRDEDEVYGDTVRAQRAG